MVPVLVLDVTEEEADKILLTLDPLAAKAKSDAERVKALGSVQSDNDAVKAMLERLGREAGVPSGGHSRSRRRRSTRRRNCRPNGARKWGSFGKLGRIGWYARIT
jgi:hypothetical protein